MATTPARSVRIHEDTWDPFTENTRLMGSDNSGTLREFMDWYNGVPGAELPVRPCDLAQGVDPREAMRRHRMVVNTVSQLSAVFAAGLDQDLARQLEKQVSPERVN